MGFSLFQMLKKLKNLFLKQKYFNCNKVIKKIFLHKSNCPRRIEIVIIIIIIVLNGIIVFPLVPSDVNCCAYTLA